MILEMEVLQTVYKQLFNDSGKLDSVSITSQLLENYDKVLK